MQLRKRAIAPSASEPRPKRRTKKQSAALLLTIAGQGQITQTCELMQLPAEIRNRIYDFVAELSQPQGRFKYLNESRRRTTKYTTYWSDHCYVVPKPGLDPHLTRPIIRSKLVHLPLKQLRNTCKTIFLETWNYAISEKLTARAELYVFAPRGELDRRATEFVAELDAISMGTISNHRWANKPVLNLHEGVATISFAMLPAWWANHVDVKRHGYDSVAVDIYVLSQDHQYRYRATGRLRVENQNMWPFSLGPDNAWKHPTGLEMVLDKCDKDISDEDNAWMFHHEESDQ